MNARVGRVLEPMQDLGVEIVETGERAPRKKVVLDVIDEAFHFPFGASAVRSVRILDSPLL